MPIKQQASRVLFQTLLDAELVESAYSILERLNFDQLFALSEPKRVLRSKTVRGPSLGIESYRDSMYYYFNFKAFPSTEHRRHKGYIKFFKPDDPNTPLEQTECEVDCDCKDYRYRWAWANTQRDSSQIGPNSLNQCIDQAPRITNPSARPGLCKHLLALRNFLYGQDSQFPPSDDPEGPDDTQRSKLVAKSQEFYRLDGINQRSNRAIINDRGEQIGHVDDEGNPVITAGPEVQPEPTPGSALAALRNQDLEMRRRNQIRTQGGNPDAPQAAEEPPATAPDVPTAVPPLPEEPRNNPTNPTNPRSTTNRRNRQSSEPPPQGESKTRQRIVSDMDTTAATVKMVQEMVDSAQPEVPAQPTGIPPVPGAEGGPETEQAAKTPSQQALDLLGSMNRLLGELVQLQQTPEPPAEAPVDQEAAPEEPPVEEPVAPATPKQPARPMTARRQIPQV